MKTFYSYNKSNNKPAAHSIRNPNRMIVRNAFGTPEVDATNDNMRDEFVFLNGVFTAETEEECKFLDCYVSGAPYTLKNGRKFEPWLAACRFTSDKLSETSTKPTNTVTTVEKMVIPEESALLMKAESIKAFFGKVNLAIPESAVTKAELIEVLKENGYII